MNQVHHKLLSIIISAYLLQRGEKEANLRDREEEGDWGSNAET